MIFQKFNCDRWKTRGTLQYDRSSLLATTVYVAKMRRHVSNLHTLSLLDPYTASRLSSLLLKGESEALRLQRLLAGQSKRSKQRSNTISAILHYIYHHSSVLSRAYPAWMFRFAFAKTVSKKDRLRFVQEYSPMLSFSHTIMRIMGKEQNDAALRDKYIAFWKSTQLEFVKSTQFLDPEVPLETNSDKILQLKFQPQTPVSEDVRRLIKVRQQYSSVVKPKFKLPELVISVDPNRFGLPPSAERIFNMRLARLVKLQKYYRKYPPITQEDMHIFNQLDLMSFPGAVREAYVNFLSLTAFTIDDEARIAKSNILEKRIAISEKMETLYKELR